MSQKKEAEQSVDSEISRNGFQPHDRAGVICPRKPKKLQLFKAGRSRENEGRQPQTGS